MGLFIRHWSPGPGENPEKVEGLDSGLGENLHRVEGDRWDPGIRSTLPGTGGTLARAGLQVRGEVWDIHKRSHWSPWVSRSVEKPEKSKVLRSLSRSHFITSARSLLEHSQAARGYSWGALGVTTGADQE